MLATAIARGQLCSPETPGYIVMIKPGINEENLLNLEFFNSVFLCKAVLCSLKFAVFPYKVQNQMFLNPLRCELLYSLEFQQKTIVFTLQHTVLPSHVQNKMLQESNLSGCELQDMNYSTPRNSNHLKVVV